MATPFVSVTDSFVWCMSKVLKKVKEGRWNNAQVSVIDAHALDANAVFHALPFYNQLMAMWALQSKTCRGVSSYEFLVWKQVRSLPHHSLIEDDETNLIIFRSRNPPS